MMKPRSSRVVGEQVLAANRKAEALTNGPVVQRNQAQLNNQQIAAQAIRKRRSSINVYDQPSSLNSRLRQLETDMLRLDEDRTKLFDDTHAALAQYELKLNEIHAILKSRQDNVEKYVDDMKLLLQAKEEFEKQAKLLNEKHDRIQEKFMHRETTISREIKLLKNKFELLEKNRQFRSILQKSNNSNLIASSTSDYNDSDLVGGGLEANESQRTRSDATSEAGSLQQDGRSRGSSQVQSGTRTSKSVRIKMSKFKSLASLFAPLFGKKYRKRGKRKNNRISSIGYAVPVELTGNSTSNQVPGSTVDDSGGTGLRLEAKSGPDAATAAAAACALAATSAAVTAATLEVKPKKESESKGSCGRPSLIKRAKGDGASIIGRLFSRRR